MSDKQHPQQLQQAEKDDIASSDDSLQDGVTSESLSKQDGEKHDVVAEEEKGQLDETKKGLVVVVMLSLCVTQPQPQVPNMFI